MPAISRSSLKLPAGNFQQWKKGITVKSRDKLYPITSFEYPVPNTVAAVLVSYLTFYLSVQ